VTVEGDGGAGRADGGVRVNNDGGVDNGVIGVPGRDGGSGGEESNSLELHLDGL